MIKSSDEIENGCTFSFNALQRTGAEGWRFTARYTKSTVTETGDNRQQSRLSPVRSTLLSVLAANRQQLEFDSLSRLTLLPIPSTLSPVCTGPKQHGRFCRLSTKSTVLNSTLLRVCTGLNVSDVYVRHNFIKGNSLSLYVVCDAPIVAMPDKRLSLIDAQ